MWGGAASHLSLSFWKDTKLCIREGAVKHSTTSSNQTDWSNAEFIRGSPRKTYTFIGAPNDAHIHQVVQLDFKSDFATTYNFAPVDPRYTREVTSRVAISRVVRSSDGSADEYIVVYADTDSKRDSIDKWASIINAANHYGFVEPGPFSLGYRARNWPNSRYGFFVDGNYNNSNTFIKTILRSINRQVPAYFADRPHQGNEYPVPVDDTRPTPVYVGN